MSRPRSLLHHPNIARFYGIVTEVGKYALVMQHYGGGSLYSYIHSEEAGKGLAGPLMATWRARARVALQVRLWQKVDTCQRMLL